MQIRTPDARAKALLSWLLLAVGVVVGGFTVAILVAAVQADRLSEVTGALVAGGLATVALLAAFVDQWRKTRTTRAAELTASRSDVPVPADDTAEGGPVSR